MPLAVVRSIGTPRRLETAQEHEDFEQELVYQCCSLVLAPGSAIVRSPMTAVRSSSPFGSSADRLTMRPHRRC